MATMTFEEAVAALEPGQPEALLRKLARAQTGDETRTAKIFRGVLTGELRIVLVDGTLKLVDQTGRAIPLLNFKSEHVDPNRNYHVVQPDINYGMILERLEQFFGAERQFVSAAEFERQATALVAEIRENRQVAGLLNGVYLPLVLPQLVVADYGRMLEEIFLTAVERAYKAEFPTRKLNNYRKDELAGQVSVVAESRHQRLIEKMAEGPVVLLHFPTAFQGFSILGDREMVEAFPAGFTLSGAIDTATSVVAHTAALCRDRKTPVYDCAANAWRGVSLVFNTGDDMLDFGHGGLSAEGFCSGGLSFLG